MYRQSLINVLIPIFFVCTASAFAAALPAPSIGGQAQATLEKAQEPPSSQQAVSAEFKGESRPIVHAEGTPELLPEPDTPTPAHIQKTITKKKPKVKDAAFHQRGKKLGTFLTILGLSVYVGVIVASFIVTFVYSPLTLILILGSRLFGWLGVFGFFKNRIHRVHLKYLK